MTAQITTALHDGRWLDARRLLSDLRHQQGVPKLEDLQAWVGECNKASIRLEKEQTGKLMERYIEEDQNIWKTLESILRIGQGLDPTEVVDQNGVVTERPLWGVGHRHRSDTFADWQAGRLYTQPEALGAREAFSVLHTEVSRKSESSRLLYTGTIPFEYPMTSVVKGTSPFHPSVIFLANVASPETCRSFITVASAVGFIPDRTESGGIGHNFYWIADKSFMAKFFDRVKTFLPQTYPDGARLYGLNIRLRCYRYPGVTYPPHIDGTWPLSGIDEQTGVYNPNVNPPGQVVSSRLTLLLYLNDEFEGGETTFFIPRKDAKGLEAWPIEPRCGGVLIFPQGYDGLLHEGRPVVQGGKFLVRTDVMYTLAR